jgi:hypothetical protein
MSSNRKFIIPDGIPEAQIDVTSANTIVFTVPAGEKWLIIHAASTNVTQSSRSAVRYALDGTNYTGWIVSDAGPGAAFTTIPNSLNPIIILAGGKIDVKAVTFTASDTMIHHVLNYRMKYG